MEEEKQHEEHKEEEAPVVRGYQVLYYKNGNNIGIRQRFYAKTQIFSFGGKHCGKSERQLRDIAVEVVRKLEDGLLSEEEARKCAKEQVDS